jgi:hypothetical protein
MRLRLLLALLALSAVAVACGDDTSVFNLAVGDCFNDDPAGTEVVSNVATVNCSEPHDNEIYFEFSMTDAAFPGRDATVQSSGERCLAEFQGFVGRPYDQSDLEIFPITPTAESWAQGDRVVYCALYALDLSKLTGSMEGADR